jgi:hypothetical protein
MAAHCGTCVHAESDGHAARVALAALIGATDVTESDAHRLLQSLVEFDSHRQEFRGGITAEAHGHATGQPWQHVTDDERDRLAEAYGDLIASRMPRASSWGGCGMCGRDKAMGDWWQAPATLHWPDGGDRGILRPLPTVWVRRGEPSNLDDLRRVGVKPRPPGRCRSGVGTADSACSASLVAADSAGLPSRGRGRPSWSPTSNRCGPICPSTHRLIVAM